MFQVKIPSNISLMAKMMSAGSADKQDSVIRDIARLTRDYARQYAAHGHTGNLSRSIYAKPVSKGSWEVGSELVYAWSVEFGSGVYGEGPSATGDVIRPKHSSYLYFKIGGRWIRVRYILGQRPQPFLRPAIELARSEIKKGR